MAKRTHKLGSLGDVAAIVAAAPNLSAAAKQLGVNRSTLHRWLKAGTVARPEPKTGPAAGAKDSESPQDWAKAVREMGELDATQSALVDLASAALALARTEANPMVRLSAMGRYQQLVKQLNLATDAQAQAAPVAEQQRQKAPARAVTAFDPRRGLMAVK